MVLPGIIRFPTSRKLSLIMTPTAKFDPFAAELIAKFPCLTE